MGNGKSGKRSWWWLVGALAAAGLGAGAYWWLAIRRPLSGLVGAAQAVPQEATVVVAARTNSAFWQPLAQFGTPESRQLLAKAIAAAQTPWHQGRLDFQQDIQPWVGEGALAALVPLQPDEPPATLAIAPVQNRERAEVFLAKYRNILTQQGAQFTEKTYGRQVYYESPTRRPNQSVVTALIDGRLAVLTTSPVLLQRVIETYRGRSPALAIKPAFVEAAQRAQELSPRESLVWVYVDGSVGLDFLGPAQAIGDSFLSNPAAQLSSLALTAGFQKEGLRFRLDRTVATPGSAIEVPRQPLLDRLPADTLWLISGTNLRQSWATLQARAKANPISETTLTQWREALAKAQIDLDKEVLGWLTEDFAIAAVPTTSGALRGSGFGLVLLARTTVADLPRQFLTKLERWARSSPGGPIPDNLEVKSETVAQTEISTWTARSQSMATRLAAHGFLTQDVVFWAAGDLVTSLLPTPGTPLAQSPTFRRLTTGLPETTGGYFYWQVGASLPILERLLPSELKSTPLYTQGRILLDAVRGLAATTTNLDDRTVRLDLLLSLKPTPVD